MPEQLVHKAEEGQNYTCGVEECDKPSVVFVTIDDEHDEDDFFLCTEHAESLAQQLIKVTSKESGNV